LKSLLHEELKETRPEVHFIIPPTDGEAIATIYRDGEVISRQDKEEGIEVVARVSAALLGRLQRREGINVFLT
jgi:GTP-binding protein HflX